MSPPRAGHARFGATQGIRFAVASGLYRAEATDGHRAIVVQGLPVPQGSRLRELVQERMQSAKVVPDTLVEDAPARQIVLRE